MFDEPSPRKVSVSPASRPAAIWIVSRSARIWHGWNWSVSALMTGTRLTAAICSIWSCPKVRHTIAATWLASTLVMSSTDSPRPACVPCASITSGYPPSSAMPTANDTLVRSDGLSNSTATARGPASVRSASRSALSLLASASTSACSAGDRSSSRRKCRTAPAAGGVTTFPGPRARRWRRRESPAARAMNESASAADRISGGASRTASGWTALTRNPCRCAVAATAVAAGPLRAIASHRPLPRTPSPAGA